MELMAAGKPVVATAVGGVPDLVEDGVHGLLVPPGDPDALAAALATLLHDPARRAAMGDAGRERQRREFDFATMVRRLEQRLRGAARRGRPELVVEVEQACRPGHEVVLVRTRAAAAAASLAATCRVAVEERLDAHRRAASAFSGVTRQAPSPRAIAAWPGSVRRDDRYGLASASRIENGIPSARLGETNTSAAA